jgi:intracellular sulfur oxidation DsrE/DsrF family protein
VNPKEDPMRRLLVFVVAVSVLLALPAAQASHLKTQPRKHKVVYHLDGAAIDRTRFVLGNIENHLQGVGGFDRMEALELVVHGPALQHFVVAGMDPGVKASLERLQAQGLVFGACGNTMRGLNLTLEQLARGARPLPQGGVVRIMELVEEGYVYLRP